MKGLELSESFYRAFGEPMLKESFSEVMPHIAVGLAGSGSECFGYDDGISRDHDFEPGFCIFLPGEDVVDRRTEFALERAYSKLPREFMGFKRSPLDPVGGNRHGVIRMSDFFKSKTGSPDGCLEVMDWFFVPEQSVAEAVNGKVFADDSGRFTAIRERLSYMPEDVRLKKLAGNLVAMGQAGQYNYGRCILRGETAAAQLSVAEFVKSALNSVFLLNKTYIPYYKWSFHALRELPRLSELYSDLEYLLSSGNSDEESAVKMRVIEKVCRGIIGELTAQGLTDFEGSEAEGHGYSVNRRIADGEIRNLHIMYAV